MLNGALVQNGQSEEKTDDVDDASVNVPDKVSEAVKDEKFVEVSSENSVKEEEPSKSDNRLGPAPEEDLIKLNSREKKKVTSFQISVRTLGIVFHGDSSCSRFADSTSLQSPKISTLFLKCSII